VTSRASCPFTMRYRGSWVAQGRTLFGSRSRTSRKFSGGRYRRQLTSSVPGGKMRFAQSGAHAGHGVAAGRLRGQSFSETAGGGIPSSLKAFTSRHLCVELSRASGQRHSRENSTRRRRTVLALPAALRLFGPFSSRAAFKQTRCRTAFFETR
jgi:hypothetical protein